MSLRAFERPLAIAEGCIFMRVIRTLHDVAAARHIILTISRTVQLVGIVAAVVLLVAFERRVDALAVRAVERTCGCIIVTGLFVSFYEIYGEPGCVKVVELTGRTGVGTTHERKKRLARGQFPRLPVVCQSGVYAFARVRIRLFRCPET